MPNKSEKTQKVELFCYKTTTTWNA